MDPSPLSSAQLPKQQVPPSGKLTNGQLVRLSVDTAAAEAMAPGSAVRNFKRSPLGRTVVTALEARLDMVGALAEAACR
jgi:hypothetical protein